MAAKKFASYMLTGTTFIELMTGTAGKDTTITAFAANHNQNQDVKVTIALTDAPTPSGVPLEDIFELNQIVYANSSREFPGIVVPAGQKIMVRSDLPNVSFLIYGYEEDII